MSCNLCLSKGTPTKKCSDCNIKVCNERCPKWEIHKVRHMVVTTLSVISKGSIRTAIDLLVAYYKCDSVGLEYNDTCTNVAKANKHRIHICGEALTCEFQDKKSKVIPNYETQYGINHLTVVVLHEFGHVLDKRDILPHELQHIEGKEERANAFAKYFLEQ